MTRRALDMARAPGLSNPLVVGVVLAVAACAAGARADGEFSATEHRRQTGYRSSQKPQFTSWVGAWTMPGGDLMVSFTQATGPLKGRPRAPKEVQQKLNWP